MDEARREWLVRSVVAGVVLAALLYVLDPLYFVALLVGPVITGLVVALRGAALRWGLGPWVVAGLALLVYDGAVNGEDVAFHAAATVVTALLVAAGFGAGRLVRRVRPAAA